MTSSKDVTRASSNDFDTPRHMMLGTDHFHRCLPLTSMSDSSIVWPRAVRTDSLNVCPCLPFCHKRFERKITSRVGVPTGGTRRRREIIDLGGRISVRNETSWMSKSPVISLAFGRRAIALLHINVFSENGLNIITSIRSLSLLSLPDVSGVSISAGHSLSGIHSVTSKRACGAVFGVASDS